MSETGPVGEPGDRFLERGAVSPTSLTQAWRQQPWAIGAGLLLGWSTLLLALMWTQFIVALGLIGLLFKGIFGGGSGLVEFLTHTLITLIGSVALSLIGVLRTPGWIVLGALISVAIVLVVMAAEQKLLSLQGTRRLSDREARYIGPMVDEICGAFGMNTRPAFRVSPKVVPGAWCEARTIVLHEGNGLHPEAAELTPSEMRALLAHELHHWRQGDTLANRLVWAASLPIYIPYLLAQKIQDASALLGLVAWFLFWPSWLCLNLVLGPLTAARARRNEYDADQAAVALGDAAGMRSLLERVKQFEPPRNSWEKVLTAQHPPTELRIEALDSPDAEVEEIETRAGPAWRVPSVAPRAAAAVAIPVIGVIVVTAAASGHHHKHHGPNPQQEVNPEPPSPQQPNPSASANRDAAVRTASHFNKKSAEASYDLSRSEDLVRAYGDPSTMSRMLEETRSTYNRNIAQLRPYGQPSEAVVNAPTSGTRIDHFSSTRATVSVAAFTTVVVNAQPVVSECLVQRYLMRRLDSAWKITDESAKNGHVFSGSCPPPGFKG